MASVMRLPKDTIIDKVQCMFIDSNLTFKLWPYATHYALLIRITSLILPSITTYTPFNHPKLLHKLEARSVRGLFFGIDPPGYKFLDIQSQAAYVERTAKDFDFSFYRAKSNSRSLPRRRKPCHSSSFGSYACRTWSSRLTSRAQRKKIYWRPDQCKKASTSSARTGHHSEKRPGQRGFTKARISETWMDSTREFSSLINKQTCTIVNFSLGRLRNTLWLGIQG